MKFTWNYKAVKRIFLGLLYNSWNCQICNKVCGLIGHTGLRTSIAVCCREVWTRGEEEFFWLEVRAAGEVTSQKCTSTFPCVPAFLQTRSWRAASRIPWFVKKETANNLTAESPNDECTWFFTHQRIRLDIILWISHRLLNRESLSSCLYKNCSHDTHYKTMSKFLQTLTILQNFTV